MSKYLDSNGLLYLWSKIKAQLTNKVDIVEGKGLSTNDYTTAEKEKLSGISEGANKTIIENSLTSDSTTNALAAGQGKVLDAKIKALSDSMGELGYGDMMKATYDADNDGKVDSALHAESADQASSADNAVKLGGQLPAYYAKAADIPTKTSELSNDSDFITSLALPTKVSQLTNDAGYLTEHQDISGKLDKTGDGSNVIVTFAPASTRSNVSTGDKLTTIFGKISKFFTDLKTVAFTGSYNDLTDKPAIPIVTNDLTDDLKAHYDAAYTHSQQDHAPSDAQANVIEGVSVNGSAVSPANKVVNLVIPTTVSQLSDAGDYALKSELTNVYKYRGSVTDNAALPSTGNIAGDVYNVESTGMNYAWNGTTWDALGEIFEIESISNADIDEITA